jgi:signal transduction histidine kinase
MNLTSKLILLFLSLTIVPLVVVGYLAYDNGRRTIEQNTIHHLVSTNEYKQQEFRRWIQDNVSYINSLAQRPLIRDYTAVLAGQDPASPEFQATYDLLLRDHLIPNLVPGSFIDLSILRSDDGLILISTDPDLEGKYRENETFFLEGKKGTYVGSVGFFVDHDQAAMHIATPIVDRAGNLVGVLVGHADLAEMSKIVRQSGDQSPSEETYLVNEFNYFVTEPFFGQGYALKKTLDTEAVQACLAGQDGVRFYTDYRGVPVVGAYQWMPDRKLCILTEVAQAEAFAPVVALRNTMLAIGLGLAVAVALLGVLFARTITRPVHRLMRGAQEIGSGNLDHRIDIRTRDEIGQLAVAFNDMATSLHQSLGETAHSQRMVLALSQAAQAVQRAHIAQDVYRTVGEQVASLGYITAIFALAQDGQHLTIHYANLKPALLETVEKLTGLSAQSYHFLPAASGLYDRVIRGGETVFVESADALVAETVTDTARPLARQVVRLLDLGQAIVTPLQIGSRPHGLLAVSSPGLTEADMPAVAAFANQTAIALENARLYETIRRHAEELGQRVAERTQQLDQARISALNMMEDAEEARRRAEQANRDLQAEISERERTEKALNLTLADLERSNRELEQFAYVASHDLQEPLRMISSFTQLLAHRYGDQLDDDAHEFIAYAVDGANRMQHLIGDLLAYSRVGTRGGPFELTDSTSALGQALVNLHLAIEESHAVVTNGELPMVQVDEGQLVQLFQNLIGNALKFRGQEPLCVHIAAEQKDGYWVFSVRDNGIGIDPQFHERIFAIFQRLHSRNQYDGTGIGLAISKRIVERHGGEIWVESQLGQGATFYFTIPVVGEE